MLLINTLLKVNLTQVYVKDTKPIQESFTKQNILTKYRIHLYSSLDILCLNVCFMLADF